MAVGLHEARTMELLANQCHCAIAGWGHGVVKLRLYLSGVFPQTFEKCI